MLQLFSLDVYSLLDLGSTLSYMTTYVSMHLGFCPKNIFIPFFNSTWVDDSIVARKLYWGCVVSVHHMEIFVDLIEIDMVDFEVILGID